MTLKLVNPFETRTWDEWNKRIAVFSTYRLRKHYYPNKMDVLDSIVKKFQEKQRESIKLVIGQRKNLPTSWYDMISSEFEIWRNYTILIDNSNDFIECNFDEYLEEIRILEEKRLQEVVEKTSVRIRKAEEEEAFDARLILAKVTHQKAEYERRKKERREKSTTTTPVVIRRSSRLKEQKK